MKKYYYKKCGCWPTETPQRHNVMKINLGKKQAYACACLSVLLIIICKLKHQFDLLRSIVPPTSQQSLLPATICLGSIKRGFIPKTPPAQLLLPSRVSWNQTITIKSCSLLKTHLHALIRAFFCFYIGISKICMLALSINAGAFTIYATYAKWRDCHKMVCWYRCCQHSIDPQLTFISSLIGCAVVHSYVSLKVSSF